MSRAYRGYGKRALDLCVGSVAFILLLPLLALVALLVRVRLGTLRRW